jgi:hypothetical protein
MLPVQRISSELKRGAPELALDVAEDEVGAVHGTPAYARLAGSGSY